MALRVCLPMVLNNLSTFYTILYVVLRYIQCNDIYNMNTVKTQSVENPLFGLLRSFVGKLRQNPDIYPIKYYKKGKQFRRKWQGPLVK
jgi:hypothetical protein